MTPGSTPDQKLTQEPTLKEKTAKGLFWGGIGNGFQQIIQLISGIVLLNILDPEDFGIVGVLLIFNVIAQTIQDSGFTVALINKKDVSHKDYNAVFWFSIIISFIMYIGLFLAAPLIADFFKNPILIPVSRVLFLNFLICSFGTVQYAFLIRELMAKEKAKIETFSILISCAIGILCAYKGYAYWSIVIQNISYILATTIIRWIYIPWRPTFNLNFKPLKSMFSFSILLLITSIYTKIVDNIFYILLGKFYDEKEVGFYNQGNKWAVMGGTLISGMITNVAMPVLSQIGNDKERQRNIFRKMLRFGAFISFPLLLGLAFVGKDFLLIVGNGEKWQAATPFLQLFCIWNSLYFMWVLYTHLLYTYKRSDIFMWGSILIGFLQLASLAIMFPHGILPMVVVYISIYIAGLLFWQYFTHRLIGLKLSHVIRDIIPYLTITIGCILISWFVTKGIENIYLRFALKIIITAILYIAIVWKSNSTIIQECYAFFQKKLSK